jgi:hypothetical protein
MGVLSSGIEDGDLGGWNVVGHLEKKAVAGTTASFSE